MFLLTPNTAPPCKYLGQDQRLQQGSTTSKGCCKMQYHASHQVPEYDIQPSEFVDILVHIQAFS